MKKLMISVISKEPVRRSDLKYVQPGSYGRRGAGDGPPEHDQQLQSIGPDLCDVVLDMKKGPAACYRIQFQSFLGHNVLAFDIEQAWLTRAAKQNTRGKAQANIVIIPNCKASSRKSAFETIIFM